MKKRVIACLLVLCMLVSLSGCRLLGGVTSSSSTSSRQEEPGSDIIGGADRSENILVSFVKTVFANVFRGVSALFGRANVEAEQVTPVPTAKPAAPVPEAPVEEPPQEEPEYVEPPQDEPEEWAAAWGPVVALQVEYDVDSVYHDNGMCLVTTSYPVFTLISADRTEAAALIEQDLNAKIDGYREEAMDYTDWALEWMEYNPDVEPNFTSDVTVTVKYNSGDLLVVELAFWDYGGGVHPNYAFDYLMYDTATGMQVFLPDLVEDWDAVKYDLVDRVMEHYTRMHDEYGEPWLDEDTPQLVLTMLESQDAYFDHNGITVVADPYMIASFAMGAVVVEVPFEAVSPCFVNRYLPYKVGEPWAEPYLAERYEVLGDAYVGEEMFVSMVAGGVMHDVKVGHLYQNTYDGDEPFWELTDTVLSVTALHPEQAIRLNFNMPDTVTPELGISWRDEDGTLQMRGLLRDGEQGPIVLVPLSTQ